MSLPLLDQGLAPDAAVILRRLGWDAIHVSEIGMQQADDAEILERARSKKRISATLDHDFHMHLALAGQGHPSVMLLRIRRLPLR